MQDRNKDQIQEKSLPKDDAHKMQDDQKRPKPTPRELGVLLTLIPYILRHKWLLAFAAIFLLMAAGTTLSLSIAARWLVDHGLAGNGATQLHLGFLIMMGVVGLLAISSALRYYFVTHLGERVSADLRQDLYRHLLGLSLPFFSELKTGEAISRLIGDITLIETFIASSASIFLRNTLMLTGALILMSVANWQLTMILIVVIPLIIIPASLIGRNLKNLSAKAQQKMADAAAEAGESLDAIELIQAYGREELKSRRFSDAIELSFLAALARIRARALFSFVVILLIFGGIIAVLWVAALSVASGQMSAGALTQFVLLAILAASGFASLGEAMGEAFRAAGAFTRIRQILSTQPIIHAPAQTIALPRPVSGTIRLENVSFTYPCPHTDPVLQGIHLDIKPGQTIAIVGRSGAGKSSLFKLLMQFYRPDSGHIYLDNIEARDSDPTAWRAAFSYIPQEAGLFSGSIAENIAFGEPDASPDDIVSAAHMAEADNFIQARGGYDSELLGRNGTLSGGERQRLSLARALVRNAPILLLDEATSALDSEHEHLIRKAIARASEGRTAIIIAHRLSTVLEADQIIVLDKGKIVETGTHQSLMHKNGLYARLAKMQFMVSETIEDIIE